LLEIGVISTNGVVGQPIQVGNYPGEIAFDPVHNRMYVTNTYDNTVSVIDTSTNKVVGQPIQVGNYPGEIAFDPVHNRMYVTNERNDTVSVIDTSTNAIFIDRPIDQQNFYGNR
jgi:YVTN family beta-propeller protein